MKEQHFVGDFFRLAKVLCYSDVSGPVFRFWSGPGNLSNFRVDSGSGSGTRTRNPKYVSGSSN